MSGEFEVYEVALEAACRLRSVLEALRRLDRGLEDQLRRAATSVALNIAEGVRRTGRDQLHLYRVAAGSAAEVRSALGLARAWGYVEEGVWMELDRMLDRVLAMLWLGHTPSGLRPGRAAHAALFASGKWWRLTHGRG